MLYELQRADFIQPLLCEVTGGQLSGRLIAILWRILFVVGCLPVKISQERVITRSKT